MPYRLHPHDWLVHYYYDYYYYYYYYYFHYYCYYYYYTTTFTRHRVWPRHVPARLSPEVVLRAPLLPVRHPDTVLLLADDRGSFSAGCQRLRMDCSPYTARWVGMYECAMDTATCTIVIMLFPIDALLCLIACLSTMYIISCRIIS